MILSLPILTGALQAGGSVKLPEMLTLVPQKLYKLLKQIC